MSKIDNIKYDTKNSLVVGLLVALLVTVAGLVTVFTAPDLITQSTVSTGAEQQIAAVGYLPTLSVPSEGSREISSLLLIIPLAASLIVFARLVVGMRTFGVFGPLVVGISLSQFPNLLSGLAVFAILIGIGIFLTIIASQYISLPNISEAAIILWFVSLLSGVLVMTLPDLFSVAGLFFLVVITSFLIERSAEYITDHGITDSLSSLGSTLFLAVLCYGMFTYMPVLSLPTLWGVALLSFVLIYAFSQYMGLRLFELRRFSALRKMSEQAKQNVIDTSVQS